MPCKNIRDSFVMGWAEIVSRFDIFCNGNYYSFWNSRKDPEVKRNLIKIVPHKKDSAHKTKNLEWIKFEQKDKKCSQFQTSSQKTLCMSFVAVDAAQWQFSNHWISGKSLHYKNSVTLFFICSNRIVQKPLLFRWLDKFYWSGWC